MKYFNQKTIDVSKMDGNQRIAWKNIRGIFDWNVGGWYNCIQDGCPEDIPATRKEAAELIYDDALENTARPGYYGMGKAPKEMRFAGREFIMECIEYLLDTDGDAQEIAAEIWNKPEKKEIEEVDESKEQSDDVEVCGGIAWFGNQAMLMWAAL